MEWKYSPTYNSLTYYVQTLSFKTEGDKVLHMQHRDDRLDKVETVIIDWETFTKTLERNYLSDEYYRQRQDRTFVLRLYPPFESEMEAEYYESEQGRHYNSEWDEKPFHIRPELLILEGNNGGFRTIVDYPSEQSVRHHLTEEEIEDDGGIEESLKIGREMFWDELKTVLPDQFNLAKATGVPQNYTVDIEWKNVD